MAYEIEIKTPEGDGIHHEMGHFLLKAKDESGEAHEPLRSSVIRQATIPRANAMMTLGVITPGSINPNDDIYGAKPSKAEPELQAEIDEEFANKQREAAGLGGPNLEAPLDWLASRLPKPPRPLEFPDWVLDFRHDQEPSQMASGQRVPNPVGIGNLLSEFWIVSRQRDGSPLIALQYAQRVDLVFNGMRWPHVAVNTLIRQPE